MGTVIMRGGKSCLCFYPDGRRRIITSKQPTLTQARISRGEFGIEKRRGSFGEQSGRRASLVRRDLGTDATEGASGIPVGALRPGA